jgi:hypothetical protein
VAQLNATDGHSIRFPIVADGQEQGVKCVVFGCALMAVVAKIGVGLSRSGPEIGDHLQRLAHRLFSVLRIATISRTIQTRQLSP